MKNITLAIVGSFVAFATSALYGGPPAPGVAGVDVVVKQQPNKHAVTDSHGTFAFDGLAPGSYTLAFRAREARDLTRTTEHRNPKVSMDKVTVASSYSIKIEGTKHAVNQSGLTSDKLMAGITVPVDVGAGGKLRGQVFAAEMQNMVWIPKEVGSNLGGHWAAADSAEAKKHRIVHSPQDLDNMKWNANRTDPRDPPDPRPALGPR
jgi:hypothetical protein